MSTVAPQLVERFMARLEYAPTSDCWIWQGGTTDRGYGQIQDSKRKLLVHRLSYAHFVGAIPVGLHIDHLCRTPRCANPRHLEAVTRRENILRGIGPSAVNGRKTICRRGHPLSGENLWINTSGQRICRTCQKANNARYHVEQRETVRLRKRRYRAALSEEQKERIRERDRMRRPRGVPR